MIDMNLPLVVFLDDVLGKYGVSETNLDRWKKISEFNHPRLSGSSIFLIVCIRTQIASLIKLSLRTNEAVFLFNSNVVDISAEPHCLTKEERAQMLIKYVPKFADENKKCTVKDILEMENVIGFAQNCTIVRYRQNLSVDLKEIFANNMFLVEEIQYISKKNPKSYTFLVLLMLCGGCMSLKKNMNELNNKIKTISDYCGLKTLNIVELKHIGRSLCGTFLDYNKKSTKFKFHHDCIESAVFVSFGNDYPDVTLEHCSLKQLSKMCCVANENEFDQSDAEEFLNFKLTIHDDLFRVVRERFNEGLESGEKDSFQNIAEALVWKNRRFVYHFSDTITFVDRVLNFMSKRDPDGQSLLVHLINAKNTLVVKSIITIISQCCLRDHDLISRQLLLATTNACLTEEKEMLNDLIQCRDKAADFVMLAAASTGNVSIMEILKLRGGNINATLSIKNCITHPKTSTYHHDVNLFHVACSYGQADMVKYLLKRYPDMIHRTSSLGRTTVHFLAYSDNVKLMKFLRAEQVNINRTMHPQKQAATDITTRDNDGVNGLHIAASNDNLPIVKYLIENNPPMMLQNNKNGWTVMHYAAVGGSVPVMETLIQAGLYINARTNDGGHVLHIAAWNNNLPIVKYLIENNPPMMLQNDKNGWTVMHYAAVGGSVPVMETLIQAGLDINARTNDGGNLLHIARMNGNLPIVKYFDRKQSTNDTTL